MAAAPEIAAIPLMTLSMGGQPLPPPVAPITDPTPGEQYEANQRRLADQAASHDQAATRSRDAASASAGGGGGFFGKVSGMASSAASSVQKAATEAQASTEAALKKQVEERDNKRFAETFADVVQSTTPPQQLISCNSCKVMHQGQTISGEVYLCSTHLCFSGKLNTQPIKEAIPLAQIASLQPSVVLPTSKSGRGDQGGCLDDGPPFIIPVPAPAVVPTCIQVFTADGRIIQLYDFDSKAVKAAGVVSAAVTGNAWGRFYNWLDHTWRQVVPDGRHTGVTYQS